MRGLGRERERVARVASLTATIVPVAAGPQGPSACITASTFPSERQAIWHAATGSSCAAVGLKSPGGTT